MSQPTSHDDIAELVAAYAIDALDGAEAVAVEAHLATCAACRAALDEHREAASWLAEMVDDAAEAPASFERLASIIAEPPPPLRLRSLPGGRAGAGAGTTQRRSPTTMLLAAAAMVLLALGVGVLIGNVGSSSTSRSSLAQVADAAGRSAGARHITLSSTSGQRGLDVVLTSAGEGYIQHSRLAALGLDRTYQLWAVVDGSAISLGVLGPHPGVSQFRVPSGASALAVTTEVAGGVVKSANSPVASASLS